MECSRIRFSTDIIEIPGVEISIALATILDASPKRDVDILASCLLHSI